jgi:hypothetical protein
MQMPRLLQLDLSIKPLLPVVKPSEDLTLTDEEIEETLAISWINLRTNLTTDDQPIALRCVREADGYIGTAFGHLGDR